MTENINFDNIMRQITGGLTGDAKADMAYLQEQMEKYKSHEMGKEILRACGRLIYNLIPDDRKEELTKLIDNESSGTEATLEEARFNIYKKDYSKALRIMEALVTKIEDMNAFEDDQASEYHVFDEIFESVLYHHIAKPEKDIRQAQIPYTEIFSLYGSLLVELKRIPDAREALRKGLRWNPVSFSITSEYIETYKMSGDLEKFLSLTIDAFKIAFRPEYVARCYRNLGFYFVEKELWDEAIACYFLSLQFNHESGKAQSELYYISSSTGKQIQEPSFDEIKVYAQKYGFPIGADSDIVSLSAGYGKHFLEENDLDPARYFLSIAYDLTHDEEIGKVLDHLSQEFEN